jgi:hypothetical protein
MQVKFFDGLAVFEVEIGDVVAAVLRGPFAGWALLRVGNGRGCYEREEDEADDHEKVLRIWA